MSLFESIVPESDLNARFVQVRDQPSYGPARRMMDDVFSAWPDADNHFVREFQTHGFDARTWELYLRAVLIDIGFCVSSIGERPDFRCVANGETFFVEATTSNRRDDEVLPTDLTEAMQQLADLSGNHDEYAIRVGSALFSKQKKRYHELPHVAGCPLLFAIEPFHDQGALFHSDTALLRYLFGLELVKQIAPGVAVAASGMLSQHQHGTKIVPSGWFGHSGNEHLAGVLFSNSGTVAKFNRMGVQAGYWHPRLATVMRAVYEFNPDPDALVPNATVEYVTADSNESWSEGLELIHNPNALHPIDPDWFEGVSQLRQIGEEILLVPGARHVFTQWTSILQTRE